MADSSPGHNQIFRRAFVAAPESVAAARSFVRAAMQRARCDSTLVARAVLVISELFTSGFGHGGRPLLVTVRIGHGRTIRVEVADGSDPVLSALPTLTATSQVVIDASVDRWGDGTTSWGTLVWYELDRPI